MKRVGERLKNRFFGVGSSVLAMAALAAALVGWFALARPALLALPDDFHYEAQVISLDDLYDESASAFAGEKRSVTSFSYDAVERKGGVLLIESDFDVRTIEGDRIFSVTRSYGVDRLSRRHVPGYGDHDRQGFLFGPRHAGKRAFDYWHVNYDKPLRMEYRAEENLFGLRVYRFESSFTADQTAELGHGIVSDVVLKLWIEPVSGRLVKYEDSAEAYHYDPASGRRVHPWNRFSNRFTRESVITQVALAKADRWRVVAADIAVPGFLLTCLIMLSLYRRRRLVAGLAGLAGYAVVVILVVMALFPRVAEDQVTIGIASWSDDPHYVRDIAAFKQAVAASGLKEGKNLRYLYGDAGMDEGKQREILRSFKDRGVDLVYSLSAPGTSIAKQELGGGVPIVFSEVTYPVETGLIASNRRSGNSLVGMRDWVSPRDQLAALHEILPSVSRIGFVRGSVDEASDRQLESLKIAAGLFHMSLVDIASAPADLAASIEAARPSVDALYLSCDPTLLDHDDAVALITDKDGLPTVSCLYGHAGQGSLLGTVADPREQGRRAGEKAGLILAGLTPSSLETETVSSPLVFIDLRVAERLGIAVPQAFLARARLIIR